MARKKTFIAELVFATGSRFRNVKVRLPEDPAKIDEVLEEKVKENRLEGENYTGATFKGRWID